MKSCKTENHRRLSFFPSLYNAVAHQLKVLGETPLGLKDLRTKTSNYLRANMNDFLPFLSNSDSEELFSPEQFEKYCDNIAYTNAWGGAVEVRIIAIKKKTTFFPCPLKQK